MSDPTQNESESNESKGFWVDDGGDPVYYPDEETAEGAADTFIVENELDTTAETTFWVEVWVEASGTRSPRVRHLVAVDPEVPPCVEADFDGAPAHDWLNPIEVVGGIAENPGVHGHGGGVICHEVCSKCGEGRIIDTWAQNPVTGEQGLRSVTYTDAFYDAWSEWVSSDYNAEQEKPESEEPEQDYEDPRLAWMDAGTKPRQETC